MNVSDTEALDFPAKITLCFRSPVYKVRCWLFSVTFGPRLRDSAYRSARSRMLYLEDNGQL